MKYLLFSFLTIVVCNAYGQSFNELTQSAQKAVKEKNYREAIVFYNKALNEDNGNFYIWHELSLLYYHLNKIDSSIIYCNLRLKGVPDDVDALYQRGYCYMEQGELYKAIDDFKLAFEKTNNKNSDVSFNIGKCYSRLGEFDKAISYYKLTLKIEPNDKYSFYELGFAYASKVAPDKDSALKYYNKAIDQDQNYYDPYFNRGLLYSGAPYNNLLKSHQDLERSIEIKPKNKLSYLYNGMLYRDEAKEGTEEKLYKAKEMFDKVIELYPNYADAYFERAITWYKIGILNMVCKDLNKAESLGYTKATEAKKQLCK